MRGLTKNLRRRAAIVIAVAYAFCVLAPAGALAVVTSPTVFHCSGDLSAKTNAKPVNATQKQVSATHKHADGSAHHHEQSGPDDGNTRIGAVPDHHSGKDGKSDTGNCCGLFCVSAITHDPGLTFGRFAPAAAVEPGAVTGLIGHAPSPLHRPPIA